MILRKGNLYVKISGSDFSPALVTMKKRELFSPGSGRGLQHQGHPSGSSFWESGPKLGWDRKPDRVTVSSGVGMAAPGLGPWDVWLTGAMSPENGGLWEEARDSLPECP